MMFGKKREIEWTGAGKWVKGCKNIGLLRWKYAFNIFWVASVGDKYRIHWRQMPTLDGMNATQKLLNCCFYPRQENV